MSVGVVDLDEAAARGLGAAVLGGKAAGLVAMTQLGLPVPPAFVLTTGVGRAYLRDGTIAPDVGAAIRDHVVRLEQRTGRRLGDVDAPLLVSVRSGAAVSMPGMMSTVLDVGAIGVGTDAFRLDTRRRFLRSYATTVLGVDEEAFAALEDGTGDAERADERQRLQQLSEGFEAIVAAAGHTIPEDPMAQIEAAVTAVLASWRSPRARTYRQLHAIPQDLGTAVVVQQMVFGNRDQASATGAAFSRDPTTGEATPYGDVMFCAQGEDVVAGRHATDRLSTLADRLPDVWQHLRAAMATLEGHLQDMCYVEFTIESGRLWLLQVRRGGHSDRAAVRIAVDLADEGVITTAEAVRAITPDQIRGGTVGGMDGQAAGRVLATGLGASPGVATGRIATTSEETIRLAGSGPVILVRPVTSPMDMHGIAASAGILTSSGGLASHAAVVARSLAKPAVVGAADVVIDATAGTLTVAGTVLRTGDVVSIDGSSGTVVAGDVLTDPLVHDPHLDRLLSWADDIAGTCAPGRTDEQRLTDAHAALGLDLGEPASDG